MSVKVLTPGLATSVQDLGRPGYYHLGIPVSGAMDRYSLRAANLLVGNNENTAALEAVFMGPELAFEKDAVVAVTGAHLPPKVDGVEHETWSSIDIKAGQVLSFDFLKSGARAYIAISGGIDVPVVLGSRSTYTLGALGGHKGRTLVAGDRLNLGNPGRISKAGNRLGNELRVNRSDPAQLRVLPGIYWHRITEQSGKNFFSDTWQVAPEADRIGYRFRGGECIGVCTA